MNELLIQRLHEGVELPKYATEGSAGLDLRADIKEPLVLLPGESKLIGTGLKIWVKDPNYCAMAIPRSGLGTKKGVVLANLVGLIDSDYQGELKLAPWNRGDQEVVIEPGMRIAQLVIMPVIQPKLVEVESFDSLTDRGEGGFNSTGVQ